MQVSFVVLESHPRNDLEEWLIMPQAKQ